VKKDEPGTTGLVREAVRADRQQHLQLGQFSRATTNVSTTLGATMQTTVSNSVVLGGDCFTFSLPWEAEILPGNTIAIDCETELIEGLAIPRLALVSVSSGQQHAIVHPDDIGRLILAHQDRHWAAHNLMFDFEVLDRHLLERGEDEARECLWRAVDEDRAHDTMIVDMLLRLGIHDVHPRPRDLGILAREYVGLELDKDDPYRKRYGEIIGQPWEAVAPGFFQYAIKDAIATWKIHAAIRHRAVELARRRHVSQETIRSWGVLTESIQIREVLALGRVTRNGMRLDPGQLDRVRRELQLQLDERMTRLRDNPRCKDLFRIDPATGTVQFTRSGTPRMSSKILQSILLDVASDIEADTGCRFEVPRSPGGAVSTSAKEWSDHAKLHPFLDDWIEVVETATQIKFFGQLTGEEIHPRYTILVRSGRSTSSGPSIQQVPRKGGFREMFVPSPGHFLLAVDYSFIELRTLAAICEARYGKSVLADVIRAGRDPHAYTAAILLGMTPDEFLALQASDAKKYKTWRQMAKPLNFGLPGGLGARSLVTYARRSYAVEMTVEQVAEFRKKMIEQVYPEWAIYLGSDLMAVLAFNLETTVEECWALDWKGDRAASVPWCIRRIVRGETRKRDGKTYSRNFVNRTWGALNRLNRSPMLAPLLAAREGSEALEKLLFRAGVATLTGRIRGRVSFNQARNTPFQGLAADGAKLALWRLVREGFRVVGFIHDEVLIELRGEGGFVSKDRVDRVVEIMCKEMEKVLGGTLPVGCEPTLSTCWSKEAELIERDGKVFPWQPGTSGSD
jgi:DNA polymerase I-like protein with 3'-5' exonuclease and polymerase domains